MRKKDKEGSLLRGTATGLPKAWYSRSQAAQPVRALAKCSNKAGATCLSVISHGFFKDSVAFFIAFRGDVVFKTGLILRL